MAVLNLQVTASGDDNYQETNGNANHLTSTSLRLDTNTNFVALEFRGASAAAAQTVSSAILSLFGFGTNLTVNCEAYTENAASPADLGTGSNDISARTLSTHHVTVSGTLSATGYTTFDIAAAIQDAVNIGSFSGKIMVILSWNSGTTDIAAYDLLGTTDSAKLDITYSSGGATRQSNFAMFFE